MEGEFDGSQTFDTASINPSPYVLVPSANEVLDQAYEQGLILVSAGSNCLRLAPALNISNSEIEKGVEILKQVLLGE